MGTRPLKRGTHRATASGLPQANRLIWSKQRPRYLFSGLMRCGVCGAGFSKISATHFGCSGARNKGDTVCGNRLTIRRELLEGTVLTGLREHLMDPAIYATFAAEFVAEWNRQVAADSAGREAQRADLERVRKQIGRVVDAIADGAPPTSLREKLASLEVRRTHSVSTADRYGPRRIKSVCGSGPLWWDLLYGSR